MMNKIDINNTITKAIDKLNAELQTKIATVFPNKFDNRYGYDMQIKLTINGKKKPLIAEVKKRIVKQELGLIQIQKNEIGDHYILVAEYVNPVIAEELKDKNIQFIDTAGNVYINQLPLYVFIKGKPAPDILIKKERKRIFYPKGLQFIFYLLCYPENINKTYREIADETEIALGTITWLIRDLKELGYVLDMKKKGKKLVETEKLFKRWCMEYLFTLKPNLLIGRFTAYNTDWKTMKFNTNKALWGGEIAACILTDYLKPEIYTIYTTEEEARKIILENKFKKDDTGQIELLQRFWPAYLDDKGKNTVNPMLVYADLLEKGKERNIETARIIDEKFINRFIGKD